MNSPQDFRLIQRPARSAGRNPKTTRNDRGANDSDQRRLKLADRLIVDDAGLESNVRFLRPHDEIVAMWRRCVMHAYEPERLFARFAYQVDATFAHRLDVPARGKLTVRNLREAVVFAFNLVTSAVRR